MKRKIILIDEAKCDGCGLCVPSCAEGAIQIINGKAKLVGDRLCDGLGACLGECPQGALSIEEREAEEFDEVAVSEHLAKLGAAQPNGSHAHHHHPPACPGTMTRSFAPAGARISSPGGVIASSPESPTVSTPQGALESQLGQWPIQLKLVPPSAPYFRNADLILAADCAPFAYADFHRRFLRDRAVAIGCPKLDDAASYVEKLAEIIRQNQLRSITVVYMEVPCCSGLLWIVKEALVKSGRAVPFQSVVIGIRGEILAERTIA
jgi:NAD-dependent dihydropyrimidine dehydrogenase PreA subunit